MRLLIRILANSLAILIASNLVPGFIFTGTVAGLLLAGIILGLINALIKPIVQFIALPAIFLTLGLFNILINIFLLILAARFIPHLRIETFWAAFWGVVIISLINHFISKANAKGNLNYF